MASPMLVVLGDHKWAFLRLGKTQRVYPAMEKTKTIKRLSNSPVKAHGPESHAPKTLPNTLSARERQVVMLLSEGLRNKQVAGALSLSPRTVEAYRANVMRKLKLRSFSELIRYAVRNGVLEREQSEKPMSKAEGPTSADMSASENVDLCEEFRALQSSFKAIQQRFKQAKSSGERRKLLAASQEILLRADMVLAEYKSKAPLPRRFFRGDARQIHRTWQGHLAW